MATIEKMLAEQQKLFMEAKKRLEEARRKPPPLDAVVDVKGNTLTNLKTRVVNLVRAKDEAIERFDGQIATYQKDIARLEKEIERDKKGVGLEKKTAKKKIVKAGRK